ncbi:hypothetical protein ACYTSK_02440 [Pseudomonas aeruginosa]|uniref:hypothetical protein n=1 Tax=Pseudomonas aeruginosa TaxID=287 RepID=UPI00053E11E4|nr:hypothetical protein [Pseudomonas aeruginosa]EKU7805042.1 hypothetical protein [Pseudomonas aeruginosa]EKV3146441.1 hypothetical protein [Pseudomonas aeruginosa]EKV6520648.1 hypothetical protein [Pseudomonas aeruginosa]EKW5130264.1 hypothetical protein [Pseudomonas aeruginosa]EKX4692827.1 hypothetical protein [Pseudomonas aeruginosa]
MNRLRPTIDLSYGEQEVLQRVLAEPRKIADALAPGDAREHSRIIGVLEEVAQAFAETFFQVVENLPDPEPEQTQQQGRGMSL